MSKLMFLATNHVPKDKATPTMEAIVTKGGNKGMDGQAKTKEAGTKAWGLMLIKVAKPPL